MVKIPKKYWALCIYLALASITLVVFWQVRNYEFVNYDDPDYVFENWHVKAGLTTDSITWAFTTGHAVNWHPLTWLSHMLDCHLFGTNPGWHHLTNLLLHIANTLLLFGLLKRMTGALWRSAFVAAVFALHPLHVESVAWIAERKDVLSTLFWILTMAAYLRYVKRPGTSRYLLTLLVFAMGLMAKPMLVTLPFVLLLLDYWPLGRFGLGQAVKGSNRLNLKTPDTDFQWRLFFRLVWEKVPLFILSAISSIVTFLVQQSGGVVTITDILPLKIRIINALISYLGYIAKCFWPSQLAVYYPHPGDRLSMWQAVVAALLLLVISILIIRLARKHKYLPVGWLWYLGTLVPVIGLVQVGAQAMADRYTYIPLIGLFITIAWGIPDLLAKWQYRKIALGASMMMVLLALSICTRLQLRHWRNSITLFEHALEVTDDNYIAHSCIAQPLRKQGKIDQAIAHNYEALRIKPRFANAHNNLGYALKQQGKLEEAITHYIEALRINPNFADAHKNLGTAFLQQGILEEAIAHLKESLRIDPDLADAHSNLGYVLVHQGNLDEAITHFTEALQINPDLVEAHNNLGIVLLQKGKLDEAIMHSTEALRINPDLADAHSNLGYALVHQGNLDEAITHFTEALRINPDLDDIHSNLGSVLVRQGNLDEAIVHYTEALRINPDHADAHTNLGYVLVHQGNFDEAITHFKETLRVKPDWFDPMNTLAWLLATCEQTKFHNPKEAIQLAERACELTNNENPSFLDTLAASYAAAGKFPQAVTTAEQALKIAQSSLQKKLAEQIQNRLGLYKAGRPYIESSPKLSPD